VRCRVIFYISSVDMYCKNPKDQLYFGLVPVFEGNPARYFYANHFCLANTRLLNLYTLGVICENITAPSPPPGGLF
jgi:hypothetical protein